MLGFASILAISAAAGVRAASLDLCADEYLLLLAPPSEIASVSRLARDPADSVLWREARRVASNDGRIESLVRQRPSLLVSVGGASRSSQAMARRLHYRMLVLPYPSTVSQVEANVVRLASALGKPIRAAPWRSRLRRLEASRPPARDTIFVGSGGTSFAADSLGAEWMALAGFRQRALAGGRVTLEQVAVRPPEVLLLSDYRRSQASLGQVWLDNPILAAARSRRVTTDGRPWTCSGPLMLGEVERLRRSR